MNLKIAGIDRNGLLFESLGSIVSRSLINHFVCFCGVLLLFNFSTSPVLSQDYIASLKHYTTEDGLAHREVSSIYQDSKGFMWFATPQGLNRFDGYEFKLWTKAQGLHADKVNIVAEDSESFLWLTSESADKGVAISLLQIETGKVVGLKEKFGDSLPFNQADIINRFLVASDRSIYFIDGRKRNIISYHHEKGFVVSPLEYHGSLELMYFASDDAIWANIPKREQSFYLQNSSEGQSLHYQDTIFKISLSGKILESYMQDGYISLGRTFVKDNELWFNKEVFKGRVPFSAINSKGELRILTEQELNLDEDFPNYDFLKLDYNPKSGTLLTAFYGRLCIVDLKQGVVIELNERFPQLKNDQVIGERGFFRDKNGRYWLGGNFGVYLLDVKINPFTRYLFPDLENSSENMSIAIRGVTRVEDDLIVATEGRDIVKIDLSKNSSKAVSRISVQNLNDICWSIAKIRDNSWYAGCFPYFVKFDLQRSRSKIIRTEEDINLGIWSIYEDRKGKLWLGDNWAGLKTFEPKEKLVRRFSDYNGFTELESATVVDIHEDNDGLIWLSTNKGFYELDINQGIVNRFWSGGEGANFIPTDNVQHFYQDKEGIYWLATAGQGLIRWDKNSGQFQQFTKRDGLANDVLYGIYEDDFQSLWLSSDYGIMKFDKQSFSSRSFLTKDGISHNEFNRTSHFQDQEGRIYFGGLNGVTAFDPKDFQNLDSLDSAPLQITSFFQFDGEQNQMIDKTAVTLGSREIIMAPNDRFFLLRFALLNYEKKNQITYAYQIEGVDKDWNFQKENFLRLSRIPYGNHKLRIKGQSGDGNWSKNELEIRLSVLRPFYLQWWFFLFCGLTIIAIGYSIYRFYMDKNLQGLENKKIMEIDLLKSRLYTYISHEFRTPLTVIMGMADNLKDYVKEKQLIIRNSNHLLQLVNQLLDLSKLEAGSFKLKLKQADIVSYLQYLIESFYSMAQERNLRLTFDSEEKELIMDFDEVKIQKIIYNLISNAIKFNSENGVVVVSMRKVQYDNNNFAQIRVKDSGIGISKEEIEHIFDRFYQVDGSSTREREGTGIGLALAKELIELMNGSVTVESELNKGTAFTILLPITNQASFGQSFAIDESIINGKGSLPNEIHEIEYDDFQQSELDQTTLLIIEDNRDAASYIRSCISEEYRVLMAMNGSEGIKMAFSKVPDIIISDVMMPEKDGYEVTEVLKNDEKTSHIPIILLTAKATMADKIEGLSTGADAYLIKPFHKEELVVTIKNLIKQRQRLQDHFSSFSNQITPQRTLTSDELFIQKLHTVIQKNLENTELSIDNLCQAAALSQAQLYRKIKVLTGKTPAHFIRSIRLAKAIKLLQESELNIAEVAYKVGFSDPNYFSRVFSQEFGRTASSILSSR